MKTGYDQFFKDARRVADKSAPKIDISKLNSKHQKKSSGVMAQELRAKLRPAIAAKRKKSQVPWKLIVYSFMGVVLAATGLHYYEDLDRWLHRIEISLVGNVAQAETDSKQKAESAPATEKKTEAQSAGSAAVAAETKKDFSEEEINHFQKLAERKRELDLREEELNRMEQELVKQQEVLEKKMQELQQTRRNISSVLEERVQADEKKVDTLVQVYSNMKPQQAAKVFESMDEDLAVEILGRMKRKNAAEIMNLIKADKAQVLTEKYAGYKRD